MPEINKVQLLIRRFAYETKDVVADDKAAAEWLRAFRNKLIYQDMITDSMPFAEALLQEALDFNEKQRQKANARWKDKNSDAEQAGGVVDSNTITHTTAALPANHRPVVTSRIPDCKDMVIDFAVEHGIDVDDAVQMWEMTIERNGRTKDGKIITNWNGYLMSCCKTKTKKRSQQEG